MTLRFGVDTGGTFTDVVARDGAGTLFVHKLLSTPDDPSRAIAQGVAALGSTDSASVVHGTTVATNALLERRGCAVLFVTTRGFEDLLVLRRQQRPDLYALAVSRPAPLSTSTLGVDERVAHDGSVLEPLDAASVARCVEAVREIAPESVAICLLHSYASDVHEVTLATALRAAFPGLHVSVSSELSPEFRELERASTTVVNAYVGPTMARYIERIGERLPRADVEVLVSSGDRISLHDAGQRGVETVFSGPAGGVLGAAAAAAELGIEHMISFDMGGTSTDVSLCDGSPTVSYEAEIAGVPLRMPTMDILTVGAGGGSLAYVDRGGALRVGPRSAGAVPGPAAYGRGGTEATVTDAHVVLGSLRPEAFLGGELTLDVAAATAAVDVLARRLGLGRAEVARGILDVADATMARAVQVISSRRARDPRDYALISFGGAGGLHACRLAVRLGIDTVVVPREPGLLSAWGMLHAARTRRYARTVLERFDVTALARVIRQMRTHAAADFGPHLDGVSVDLRYVGQSFEITVEVGDDLSEVLPAFAAQHLGHYGYSSPNDPVELVAVRLTATQVHSDETGAPELVSPANHVAPARVSSIDLGRDPEPTQLVARESITESLAGPAVITEYSGTTVVPRGWTAAVRRGHLVLRSHA